MWSYLKGLVKCGYYQPLTCYHFLPLLQSSSMVTELPNQTTTFSLWFACVGPYLGFFLSPLCASLVNAYYMFRQRWIPEGTPFYLTSNFTLHESHLKITTLLGLNLPAAKLTSHYRAMILYQLYLFEKVILKSSPKSWKPWRPESTGITYSKTIKKKTVNQESYM